MTGRILTIVMLPAGVDGSSYHRMYQPYEQMVRPKSGSRHLVMITPPGRTPPPPSRDDVDGVDVLVSQRPVGALGMRTMDALEGATARVYEIDDDLLSADPSGLPLLCGDERLHDSLRYCLAAADMVTVSTPYLADLYSRYNPRIRVLPNCIDARVLDLPQRRRDRVTVGWAGGSSHLMDMCAVQDPLRQVLDARPDVDMHFVGVDYSPLLHRECLWSPWTQDIWDYYRAVDFDIGIAPLADVPFNRSKSYLKALDYGALGIPVVAQDMEPYRGFVRDGETGFLVGSAAEWVDRLSLLISDGDLRAAMGAKGRELAAGYLIQDRWREWTTAYEEAAG